ncbi:MULTISPECIES: hypothetical protein [unclassified Acidovorax]|uniref:hypothetical protein n=1 Tax=unclassified Acidovorax TaxID=2684926 RepID=UPI0012E0D88F|nr:MULTISPECIES: hypothetical protein [unclassified Acidovorax]
MSKRIHFAPSDHGYEIRGGTFDGRILMLGATDVSDTIVGGVTFTNCEFRMKRVAKTDFNFDATCLNCDFHLPKRVSNRYMDRPKLDGCRFHGHYVGFDFGPKFRVGIIGPSPGNLRNCDFSSARLHLCAFYGTSLSDHKWPGWPHVFLDYSNGASWAHLLASSPIPDRLKIILQLRPELISEDSSVNSECIVSVYLPEIGIDPEALWPLIQDTPEIWFPEKDKKSKVDAHAVRSAQQKNADVADKLAWERNRLVPFNLLTRCWLTEVRPTSDGDSIELVFNTTYLQSRVPDAPPEVRLVLEHADVALRTPTETKKLVGMVEKYMPMSALLEEEAVVLKPHRKERGQVILNFDSCVAFEQTGISLDIEKLGDYVNRYWRQ